MDPVPANAARHHNRKVYPSSHGIVVKGRSSVATYNILKIKLQERVFVDLYISNYLQSQIFKKKSHTSIQCQSGRVPQNRVAFNKQNVSER